MPQFRKSLRKVTFTQRQCLGPGSVGLARFGLPGSGSAKICGSTDPDPRSKISTKNSKENFFYSQPKFELFKKERLIKFPDFCMVQQVLAEK